MLHQMKNNWCGRHARGGKRCRAWWWLGSRSDAPIHPIRRLYSLGANSATSQVEYLEQTKGNTQIVVEDTGLRR